MTVVCVGETMGAIRMRGPLRLGGPADVSIAGSESNVAIGLRRLGVESAWVGVVGDDEVGALVLRTLRAEDVGCAAARTDGERPTGLIVFEPCGGGRTRALYHRRGSAGATLSPGDVKGALQESVTAVFTTGITLVLGEGPAAAARLALSRGRARGAMTCLAVNHRTALASRAQQASALDVVLGDVDVLVAAEDELALAAEGDPERAIDERGLGDAAAAVLTRGPREVVITRGDAGAVVVTHDGRADLPAIPTDVRDTVGAGDAFTAGYLAGRLAGADPARALARGIVAGAFCVGAVGDWEGMPSEHDLRIAGLAPGAVLR